MLDNITEISVAELRAETQKKKDAGWRLASITCVDVNEAHVDIYYHFDKHLGLSHLKLSGIPKAEPTPSISGIYMAAFLTENEIQDHFGLCFEGLVIDYNQTLFLDKEVRSTPFCKYGVSEITTRDGA